MSLYTIDPPSDRLIIALLSSNVLFDCHRKFINCSVNTQADGTKRLPIIVPAEELAFLIESLANKAIEKKQELVDDGLESIEKEIEDLVKTLYSV